MDNVKQILINFYKFNHQTLDDQLATKWVEDFLRHNPIKELTPKETKPCPSCGNNDWVIITEPIKKCYYCGYEKH